MRYASFDSNEKWKFLDTYRGTDFNGVWPTIPEMFAISAKRFPHNKCLFTYTPEEESFTYTEVQDATNGIAGYLANHGMKRGDTVVLTGKNSPEWALAFLGILQSGATVVPLDNSYHDKEIYALADFVGAHWLIADKERIASMQVKDFTRISLEPDSSDPFLLDCREKPKNPIAKPKEHDLAAILFTSGTTGTPKGVMLSHANLVSDCYIAQSQLAVYPTDVFYAILPIHHAYTMQSVFIETIGSGASCLFGKKLVVSQILKDLKDGNVTMFLGVPMLFNKFLSGLMKGIRKRGLVPYLGVRALMGCSGFVKKTFHVNPGKRWFKPLLSKLSLDTNRLCICGGGPLPASTYKLFNELGVDFVQGYGLTEASPMTHLTPPEHFIASSVGRSFPGEEVKILNPDEDGNGLICIKGPNVMQGYYHNEEATREVLSEDGWLNTGDVGHEDGNKYLYLTGRAKNIIVTEGGKNVFPEEIEDHFQLYDEIEAVCVMGFLQDKKMRSEGILALIYPASSYTEGMKKSHPSDAEARIRNRMETIVSEVNKNLLGYKRIAQVTVVDKPFPMTSTKKVKRFLVAKEYGD
jgi:long-chain acyl-CoA synthetase